MKKNQILWVGLICCSLFLFSACLKNDNPTPSQPATYLYLAQTSPDAPGLDLYLNDTLFNTQPLDYLTSSEEYIRIRPGSYQFDFTEADGTDPLASVSGNLLVNEPYSLISYDSAAALKTMLIHDEFTNTDPSKTEIRFFQLSPNTTDSVDVYLNDEKVFSGRTFADNVEDTSLNHFITIDGGTYSLTVCSSESGDTLASRQNVGLQLPSTIFLVGLAGHTDDLKLQVDGITHIAH